MPQQQSPSHRDSLNLLKSNPSDDCEGSKSNTTTDIAEVYQSGDHHQAPDLFFVGCRVGRAAVELRARRMETKNGEVAADEGSSSTEQHRHGEAKMTLFLGISAAAAIFISSNG
ncbi:unnamed protein product [Cuscuta epithymum]|uniref:Uncharacterized protein n=1 Tax=Cuscuta epithymum TaxID=186058 RepID=A0AAV0D9F2_9ASTE|nr:unnamed protein product [Cuscuta epithymum]